MFLIKVVEMVSGNVEDTCFGVGWCRTIYDNPREQRLNDSNNILGLCGPNSVAV